jgi:putative transposase
MKGDTRFARAKWADKLGVSTSGYYEWLQNCEHRRRKEQELTEKVKAIFDTSNQTYGAERICGILRSSGQKASYRVIKRIMDRESLKPVHLCKETVFLDRQSKNTR